MTKLSPVRKSAASHLTEPAVRLLARTHITPSAVTWLGFSIALGAAALIATGHLFIAGFVVLAAGFFDMLDGALARYTGQVTRFGAILDSVLDRVSEAVLLLGILAWYVREISILEVLLVSVALLGSLLVSYIRARAEALGMECEVGLFTRPERVVVLAIGLIINQIAIALGIMVAFSFFTVGQRMIYVWRQTRIK